MRGGRVKKSLIVAAAVGVALVGWRVLPRGEGTAWAESWRLVYVSRSLQTESHVEDIRGIADRAAASGLNGIVLAAAFDRIALQQPAYFERLSRVKTLCDERNLALIPAVFSVGHGNTLLDADRHLAAAVPVRDLPLVADSGRARVAATPVAIANGDFENARNDALDGFALQDAPGKVTFTDRTVHRRGSASIRLSNFPQSPHGLGRLMQEVPVVPFRSYRIRCWVKTEDLEPTSAFQIQVRSPLGRELMMWDPRVPATGDWMEVVTGFNSLESNTVRIYAGVWNGRSGTVWIDDLEVEITGPVNVLRRPGTPVAVRGENGMTYEEGNDFVVTGTDGPTYRFDAAEATVDIPPGSRIRPGERLRMDYYQAVALAGNQMAVCLSEPAVADLWREEIRLIERHLTPGAYFIACDEVRQGGWCAACRDNADSAAEILGKAVRLQADIIRVSSPDAAILLWSDMFDPNHNARDNYCLFNGDFAGSWRYLPEGVVVACWNAATRRESLAHFDHLGLRTIAAAYFDSGSDENTRAWLEAMSAVAGASGAMYTTWRSDYSMLDSFGQALASWPDDS